MRMSTSTFHIRVSGRILLVFVLVPLVELTLLVQLYQRTSFLTTLLVVVLTGILGVTLARKQGLQIWLEIHQQLAQGKNPSVEIINGVMILFSGVLLMTPGLLTDCVGFCLLIPLVRTRLRRRLVDWFRARTIRQFGGRWPAGPFHHKEQISDQPRVRVVDPDGDRRSSAAG